MAQDSIVSIIPLSGGIRRSRDADPFFVGEGEMTEANCGTFTEEGGFLQHGGISKVLSAALADGGNPVWFKRWYRGPASTNPILILSSAGTLYWADTSPTDTGITLVVAQDFTTGSGVNITGLSSTYFTVAEHSGWLYLCPNDTSDAFYRFDGSKFYGVGAIPPLTSSLSATPIAGATDFAAGTYHVKVTFVYGTNGELGESNAGPDNPSAVLVATNLLRVGNIPTSTRLDILAVRIYRTLVNAGAGGPYYFAKEVTIGTTTTDLTAGDPSLAFANYELEIDHDLPPAGRRSIQAWRERTFLIVDSPRNRIHLSIIDQPDVFPASAGFFSDELNQQSAAKLTGFFEHAERIFVSSGHGVWVLNGDRNENFYWGRLPGDEGFFAERSVVNLKEVVLGLGTRNLLVFDGIRMHPIKRIRGLLDQVDVLNKDDAQGAKHKDRYYLAVKTGASASFNRILLVDVDPKPASQGFATATFETEYQPDKDDPSSTATFTVESIGSWVDENDRIFVGRDDGLLYEFDRGTSVGKDAEDSAGMDWTAQSGWFFPAGPYAFNVFRKLYAAIEDDGSGGIVDLSWEIMDDNPNSFRAGTAPLSLLADSGAVGVLSGRWNQSRWA